MFNDLKSMNKRQVNIFVYLPTAQFWHDGFISLDDLEGINGSHWLSKSHCGYCTVVPQPAFHRGDILFLTNYEESVRVGDIVVFKVEGRDIPIVHRVIKLHGKENGTVKFLTKGDNNNVDDRRLYAPGQLWITKNDVVGRARGFLPYVGMVTIYMNEYPKFKYGVLALCGIYILANVNNNEKLSVGSFEKHLMFKIIWQGLQN